MSSRDLLEGGEKEEGSSPSLQEKKDLSEEESYLTFITLLTDAVYLILLFCCSSMT